MAHFDIRIESSVPAPTAWGKVLDLRAHSDLIPLTSVTGEALEASDLRPGSRFTARTGVGPLAVHDRMVVESIEQPSMGAVGTARIRKHGRVIQGVMDLTVTPREGGSTIEWSQDIDVKGVPARAAPVVAAVARAAYAMVLKRLLARP